MVIVDKPNLERIKRALNAYNSALAGRALNSSDQANKDYYDPEMKAVDDLLKIVDQNLERISDFSGINEHGG
jgi:hypothetical protein